MATKPTPGASDGTYGTEMNAFLDVSLASDGKIINEALQTASTAPVADAALANKKYVDDQILAPPASVSPTTFVSVGTFFGLPAPTELTISGGAVTATLSYHTIDTESDDSTDDLSTISGGSVGDILLIRADNSARTVVLKDATGNLVLAGDFSLDNSNDAVLLVRTATTWIELSRSNNAA